MVFLFASLSLMAFPFTAGFYSKDFILEILLVPLNFTHTIAYILTLLAALLTTIYSTRTLMITKLSRPLFPQAYLGSVKDSGWFMTLPLLLLSIGAIFLGYMTNEIFLSFGSTFYINSIFIHPDNLRLLDASNAGSFLGLIPLFFLIFAFLIPLIITYRFSNTNKSIEIIKTKDSTNKILVHYKNPLKNFHLDNTSTRITPHSFSYNLIFLNHINIINHWIIHRFLILSNYLYRYMDKGALEIFGPKGINTTLNYLGFKLELLATGNILNYALIKIKSIMFILLFYLSI